MAAVVYLRRLLRLGRQLGQLDSFTGNYVRRRTLDMYRLRAGETDPRRVRAHVKEARKASRLVGRALAGERKCLVRVMDLAYGRVGKLRYLMFHGIVPRLPETALLHSQFARKPTRSELFLPPMPPSMIKHLERGARDLTRSRFWRRACQHMLTRARVLGDASTGTPIELMQQMSPTPAGASAPVVCGVKQLQLIQPREAQRYAFTRSGDFEGFPAASGPALGGKLPRNKEQRKKEAAERAMVNQLQLAPGKWRRGRTT